MEDLFKKVLYTGVGLVTVGAEKLQETVDKLVGENKISVDEGKKIVEDFFKNTEARRQEFESKIKEATEKVIGNIPMVTKADFDALVKRVEGLEAKHTVAKTSAAKTTSRKAAATKTSAAKSTTTKAAATKTTAKKTTATATK